MTYLLRRNIRIESDLIDHLFNSSEKRLARLLLLLANFGKEGQPLPIIAPISQETLAEMIGTTRARVNFFMNRFRRLGFINYNGQVEVHRSLNSVDLHEYLHPSPDCPKKRSQADDRESPEVTDRITSYGTVHFSSPDSSSLPAGIAAGEPRSLIRANTAAIVPYAGAPRTAHENFIRQLRSATAT